MRPHLYGIAQVRPPEAAIRNITSHRRREGPKESVGPRLLKHVLTRVGKGQPPPSPRDLSPSGQALQPLRMVLPRPSLKHAFILVRVVVRGRIELPTFRFSAPGVPAVMPVPGGKSPVVAAR